MRAYQKRHFPIRSLLLAAVLILSLAGGRAVRADEAGSLTLRLSYTQNGSTRQMESGRIAIYLVASVQEENGDKRFDVSTGKFADSSAAAGIAMMDSEELTRRNAELSASLEKESATVTPDATASISNGTVTFKNLKAGLYFVHQEEASKDKESITPFLITVCKSLQK